MLAGTIIHRQCINNLLFKIVMITEIIVAPGNEKCQEVWENIFYLILHNAKNKPAPT
jgi:hypothetical protein